MNVLYLLFDKYIFFRNTLYTDKYWCESALGYTDNIEAAGVYSGKDTIYHNLRVFSYEDIKEGKHRKYTHYAMPVAEAIKLLK